MHWINTKSVNKIQTSNATSCRVSIWTLTSCQPRMVISGQSNLVVSKCTFQNPSSIYIYPLKSIHKTNPHANTKYTYINIKLQFLQS